MTPYTRENARNDLEIIDWLLNAGAISQEEASFMREYVQSLK